MTGGPPQTMSALALEKRAKARAHAAAMGIDETYINDLVEAFYARIRKDSELGPIFERAIGTTWPDHLARMKLFWASVALNAAVYSGKPVPAHRKLKTVQTDHFERWIALFEQTLRETAASDEAVDYFMVRARRIAESLKLAMFGSPGLEFLCRHE